VNLLEALGRGTGFEEAFLRYIQMPFAVFQQSLESSAG
jgi:hypothetical protein